MNARRPLGTGPLSAAPPAQPAAGRRARLAAELGEAPSRTLEAQEGLDAQPRAAAPGRRRLGPRAQPGEQPE